MSVIIECPNCRQKNEVEAQKLRLAKCGACHESLAQDDVIPATFSDEEIATAVESAPSDAQEEEVDTDSWTSKIGDHDEQVQYVNNGFWSKVRKYASKVPFSKEAVAMYYCAMDPNTPTKVKVTAIGALAYWILPIDLVPDIFPLVGYGDDATAIFVAYKAISSHITDEHRDKAEEFFAK
ncbi:Uncharacterized membrane protein YkvA, DUF1232 family [Paenibacillus catalpae]|uniref:Uncharacterized membrane protein YkvA, DUF1232 family n=1 Tax=Paenibacillus catalpae TaxID=1045775 RepID=A0A1I1YJU3_9BACL|nr:YkvA family protein [Paenibacillus catalpae]SFE19816.1 Uncharacterized membrane protein YkvA, DUF1232 family [Paenibacillus catalpae]